MEIKIRNISIDELQVFSSILLEGAQWLAEKGMEMWDPQQLTAEKLQTNHSIRDLYMGYVDDEPAAVMILQESDHFLWPEDKNKDSMYLHKLCVKRKYARTGLSSQMIQSAKEHARECGKKYLKLDCAADRKSLCAFYASQGFWQVNERVILGKYPTAFYEIDLE
jgi:GNAT superfamily N-acetyltransferase